MPAVHRALVLTTLLTLLAVPAGARSLGPLKVGTCQADITPIPPDLVDEYEAAFGGPATPNHTDPVYLAGFGTGRAATGYNDRLWARGVVLERRGVRVAIVTLDTVSYFKNEIDTIRAMVTEDVDYVLVTSTHQHEGPDTIGLWGPDDFTTGIDYGYLDFVNATVASCIDDAARNLRRARVHFAETTSEGLSLGLDAEDDGMGVADGKVLAGDDLLAPDTEGRIVDARLQSLVFTEFHYPFAPVATLVSFGSHPESLGSGNTLITADFPHYARERIEEALGGLAVWVSADLGVLQGPLDLDVEDPDTGLPAPRRTFDWAEVHGTQLADRALEAIDEARFFTFEFRFFGFHFSFQIPLPGIAFPRLDFATVSPVVIPLDNPLFHLAAALDVLNTRRDLFTDGVPDDTIGALDPPADFLPSANGEDIHTEVGAIRLGHVQIAAIPTELDPQIGESYRELLEWNGARHTMIFGLAGDHIGYQVPFDKWDDSCHACASYVALGIEGMCPVQPVDCNTVFSNNVGQQVDPQVTEAFEEVVDAL